MICVFTFFSIYLEKTEAFSYSILFNCLCSTFKEDGNTRFYGLLGFLANANLKRNTVADFFNIKTFFYFV